MKIDDIDRRIIRELQANGRVPNNELAAKVGLSPSPCLRRVRLLEEAGVVRSYVAIIDHTKIDLPITLFVRVSLTAQDAETLALFTAAMRRLPEVVECFLVFGEVDALLRVVAADLHAYRMFQMVNLTRKNGIESVRTDVPSEIIKQNYGLPV